MKIEYRKKFLKKISGIPPDIRLKIEKLSGYNGFYKVRFGVFRLGIESKDDKVLIMRTVKHRGEIYKFFP